MPYPTIFSSPIIVDPPLNLQIEYKYEPSIGKLVNLLAETPIPSLPHTPSNTSMNSSQTPTSSNKRSITDADEDADDECLREIDLTQAEKNKKVCKEQPKVDLQKSTALKKQQIKK